MPKLSHWIVQYLMAIIAMFALLLLIDLLVRGEVFARAWPSSLIWAAIASTLFVGTRFRNMKHGIACAVCDALDKRQERR